MRNIRLVDNFDLILYCPMLIEIPISHSIENSREERRHPASF